ncbi:Rubisco LSMT substrate-binding protein [Gracilaria domingensis]|nr:Rubisco LSMT substrate-binding protein [Gracilaria domingensis]
MDGLQCGFVATHPLLPRATRRQLASKPRWKCSSAPHLPDRSIRDLITWCEHVGISSPLLTVREEDGLRGLYATQHIRAGDELFCIPRSTALQVNATDRQPPPMHVLENLDPSFWKGASWHIRLAVLLLDQCLAGTDSYFSTYVKTLPSEPTSVLWAYRCFGRASLASQLSPYRMMDSADLYLRRIKSKFQSFQKSLPERLRPLVSLQQFCWASSNVVSRAFGIPAVSSSSRKPVDFAMFPMLDMANGSVHVPTRILYDNANDCFRVVTGASFSPGEQVYVSYGSKSNDDFMFFYGYVEGDNPSNTVTITDFREWILQIAHRHDSSLWDRKLATLRRVGLANKDNVFGFHMDKLDDDLMAALRIATASASQLDIFERNMERKPASKKTVTVDLENELKAWDAILAKCHSLLAELPKFTEADQERLSLIQARKPCTAKWDFRQSGSEGELLFCHERARVLRATLERVSHFSKVSQSVGRICTVLLPPSQQLLRADLFHFAPGGFGASDVRKLNISHEDIRTLFNE